MSLPGRRMTYAHQDRFPPAPETLPRLSSAFDGRNREEERLAKVSDASIGRIGGLTHVYQGYPEKR